MRKFSEIFDVLHLGSSGSKSKKRRFRKFRPETLKSPNGDGDHVAKGWSYETQAKQNEEQSHLVTRHDIDIRLANVGNCHVPNPELRIDSPQYVPAPSVQSARLAGNNRSFKRIFENNNLCIPEITSAREQASYKVQNRISSLHSPRLGVSAYKCDGQRKMSQSYIPPSSKTNPSIMSYSSHSTPRKSSSFGNHDNEAPVSFRRPQETQANGHCQKSSDENRGKRVTFMDLRYSTRSRVQIKTNPWVSKVHTLDRHRSSAHGDCSFERPASFSKNLQMTENVKNFMNKPMHDDSFSSSGYGSQDSSPESSLHSPDWMTVGCESSKFSENKESQTTFSSTDSDLPFCDLCNEERNEMEFLNGLDYLDENGNEAAFCEAPLTDRNQSKESGHSKIQKSERETMKKLDGQLTLLVKKTSAVFDAVEMLRHQQRLQNSTKEMIHKNLLLLNDSKLKIGSSEMFL